MYIRDLLRRGCMLNFASLLYSTVENPTFYEGLEVPEEWWRVIRQARTAIRQHLRVALPSTLAEMGLEDAAVTPRFLTQGSVSYGTLNRPAKADQQIDIDDGVYLPLSGVSTTGTPRQASSLFFEAVEQALEPLLRAKGWRLDTSKATCVRVLITDYAHVDIPLYAIPDQEFVRLSKSMVRLDSAVTDATLEDDQRTWEQLPEGVVLLAHRKESWKRSDPRPLTSWFKAAVTTHGPQVLRVVRYLKAFRDWHVWEGASPSSVALMAAAVAAFIGIPREDKALASVLDDLPDLFRAGVANPTDPSEMLTDALGPKGREEAARALREFGTAVRAAMSEVDPHLVCTSMRKQLGDRFPQAPERVREDEAAKTAAPVAAGVAAPVASPLVGRTRAG